MLSFICAVTILAPAKPAAKAPAAPQIVVTMSSGKTFVIQTDPKDSPKTVAGINALVKKKFYDKQRFHRVEDWVIQWGAPASVDKPLDSPEVGGGGSNKYLPFEASKTAFKRGVVGIASTGSKVGGDSQLFILLRDADQLNGNYAVLGKVTKGMDVVDKIKVGDRIKTIRLK